MRYKHYYSIFFLSLVVSACSPDESAKSKADQAKMELSELGASATESLAELNESEAFQHITALLQLLNEGSPFGRKAVEDHYSLELDETFLTNVLLFAKREEPFGFEGRIGRYDWNESEQKFIKYTGPGSEAITSVALIFPVNLTTGGYSWFNISDWKEIGVQLPGSGNYYTPVQLSARFSDGADSTNFLGIDHSAYFTQNGFPRYNSTTLNFSSYKLTANYSDSVGNLFTSLRAELLDTQRQEYVASLNVKSDFSSTDKNQETLTKITGYGLLTQSIQFSISIDVIKARASNNPNDYLTGVLWVDQTNNAVWSKYADLFFKFENGEYIAYLRLSDNSEIKVETAMATALEQLSPLTQSMKDFFSILEKL